MDIFILPKTLFLRGVYKHNKIQNTIEKKIQADIVNRKPMMTYYTDDKTWLLQRQVQCATCSRMIVGKQIFIPHTMETGGAYSGSIDHSHSSANVKYKCYNNSRFCTWWCASYHVQHFINSDKHLVRLLLIDLYKKWEGKHIYELLPALPIWRLVDYGGDLTIEEYHKLCEYEFFKFNNTFERTKSDFAITFSSNEQ